MELRLRKIGSALVFCLMGFTAFCHEGMWIPSTLTKLVMGDMKDAGLRLSAEDIYSINESSLKDAIVHFGGGCTAEVISREGLILTNHHCGYSQIQSHSSVANDYLKNGFWAMNKGEELANKGLSATFVVRIEDVTTQLMNASQGLEPLEARAALSQTAQRLQSEAIAGTHYKAEIKPFFYGNAYYMIVTETYEDVRLVGAPPSAIGKFGGDTDNWEWPRHTGDFSVFRIYADADNNPAPYSENNVPYTPKYSLPIHMDGLNEGDFTMVFGFPGRTEQFLTSYAVAYVLEKANPARIAMREASLGVIDQDMASNDTIRIQYAAKQSSISNSYKKWIGQSLGLTRYHAVEKKQKEEAAFQTAAENAGNAQYAQLLTKAAELYKESNDFATARDYFIEFFYYGPEALRFAYGYHNLVENFDSLKASGLLDGEFEKLKSGRDGFYKNYNRHTDQKIFAAQAPIFAEGCPAIMQPPTFQAYMQRYENDGIRTAEALYSESVFDNQSALEALLSKSGKKMIKTLAADPLYRIAAELLNQYRTNVASQHDNFRMEEESLMQTYVKAIMELEPDANYWPDANSTLRLSFGKMEGSEPRDGMTYKSYSTLEGIAQKYIPGHVDFDVPPRLLELHEAKDYGIYATDGELRVCFLGSNHTTGGNSGSPALNADGHLVGINFDRTWESTMSDIMFNGEICRNIMVDIKYVLFIIDIYAGAGHLVDEMELVYSSEQETVKPKTETLIEAN